MIRISKRARRSLSFLLFAIVATPLQAATFKVDTAASLIGIVTHKAGIASGAAHNHLIQSKNYALDLTADPASLETGSSKISFTTKDLVVDDFSDAKKWFPLIKDLGLLDEAFSEVSASDREEIKKGMLADDQLDAAKFPTITAELKSLKKAPSKKNTMAMSHEATLSVQIHGKTVEAKMPVLVEVNGANLKIVGTSHLRFTQFGIEPFSAFLGAVKNEDEFDIVISLAAAPG